MLAALLAARGSEVAGLRVGDVDWVNRVVTIEPQHYPGKGGQVVKQTKGRRARYVPILDPLEPTLRRLTDGKDDEAPLLRGPRGGVLTTATIRDATHWDNLVKDLGMPDLTRHSLRHTGAIWLADAGIPLHVLQEILGHQSIETTKGYLHSDHRHLAEAVRQANRFLARADQNGVEPPKSTRALTTAEPAPTHRNWGRTIAVPPDWSTREALIGPLPAPPAAASPAQCARHQPAGTVEI